MMETAEPGTGDDHRRRRRPVLDGALVRRIFRERIMDPILLVIGDIFSQQPAQVTFIQRDDMVEDFPAGTSDPAFSDSILPGSLYARLLWLQTRGLQKRDDFGVELRIVIQNGVTIRLLAGESLPKLLDHPIRSGVSGDVAVQNLAALVLNDEEAIQQLET